jgi:hypothetical protein
MTHPGVRELAEALAAFSKEWECDEITAVYVLAGRPLRLNVLAGRLVSVEAEDGSTIRLSLEELG